MVDQRMACSCALLRIVTHILLENIWRSFEIIMGVLRYAAPDGVGKRVLCAVIKPPAYVSLFRCLCVLRGLFEWNSWM